MFDYIKQLFADSVTNYLTIEAWWCCRSTIKLPNKVRTPFGSKVTVVLVCVDIKYWIEDGNIDIKKVRMARRGTSIVGSDIPTNVASDRAGQAWFETSLCSESLLRDAVAKELFVENSELKRVMFAKWYQLKRAKFDPSSIEALNSHASAEEISRLVSSVGRQFDIEFTYSKPNSKPDIRCVTLQGASGNCIRAHDQKDGKLKSFRIDRISHVRRQNRERHHNVAIKEVD